MYNVEQMGTALRPTPCQPSEGSDPHTHFICPLPQHISLSVHQYPAISYAPTAIFLHLRNIDSRATFFPDRLYSFMLHFFITYTTGYNRYKLESVTVSNENSYYNHKLFIVLLSFIKVLLLWKERRNKTNIIYHHILLFELILRSNHSSR